MSIQGFIPSDRLRTEFLRANPRAATTTTAMSFSVGQRRRIAQANAIAVTIRNPSDATFRIGGLDAQTIILSAGATTTIDLVGGSALYATCLDNIGALYIDTTRSETGTLRPVLTDITQLSNTAENVYFTRQEAILVSADSTPIFYGYSLRDFTSAFTYDPNSASSLDFGDVRPDFAKGGTYFIGQDQNTNDIYSFNPKTGDEVNLGALNTPDALFEVPVVIDVPAFKGYAFVTDNATENVFLYDLDFTLIASGKGGSTLDALIWLPFANVGGRATYNTTHIFVRSDSSDSELYYIDFAGGTFNTYSIPSDYNVSGVTGPDAAYFREDFGEPRQQILKVEIPSETETVFDASTGTPDDASPLGQEHYFRLDYGEADSDVTRNAFFTPTDEVAPYVFGRFSHIAEAGIQIDESGSTLLLQDTIDGQPIPDVDTGVSGLTFPYAYDPATETLYFEDGSNGYLARLRFVFDPTGTV